MNISGLNILQGNKNNKNKCSAGRGRKTVLLEKDGGVGKIGSS